MAPDKTTQKRTLRHNLTNHKPTPAAITKIEALREKAIELGELLIESSGYTREQSLALTDLENFVMHGVAGIARNENEDV